MASTEGARMSGIVEEFGAHLTALAQANAAADRAVAGMLELARRLDGADREAAAVVLEAAEAVGVCEQARHGQLIQLLGQADRMRVARGGVKAWVATHLDVSDGKARGIAEAARRIGTVPELAESLSSGRVGADTVRTLSRTAKAVHGTVRNSTATLTGMLETATSEGVSVANRKIRELEHNLDPGSGEELLARQRARSFARVAVLEDGRCRFDVLLDPVRATVLRSAIDQLTACWIRERQYDGANPLPDDVRSTEQINAHALVRLAEVFLTADAEVRGARFTPQVLFATRPDRTDGLAESLYGTLVPLSTVQNPQAHVLELDAEGEPVVLDGVNIDTDPTARLASPAQRTALAFRDRHCTYPGCTRPPTYGLHAHHRVPYGQGGATTVRNLTSLCAEHHTLTHHPQA